MPKDFNRELDHTHNAQHRQEAQVKGRKPRAQPDHDPEVARERQGEGFDGAVDEYAEAGSRGAGYRETDERKDQTRPDAKRSPAPDRK